MFLKHILLAGTAESEGLFDFSFYTLLVAISFGTRLGPVVFIISFIIKLKGIR